MRPNLTITPLICLAFAGTVNFALADDTSIALHGNNRGTPACLACHGARGEGISENGFPRLAGLNAGYLQVQLDAFANGQRINAMMTPIAKTMNADERTEVAHYYAGLRSPATMAEPVGETRSAGARLAIQGRWLQGLPACIQCHGAMGAGVGTVFPALAGQSPIYIENQLHAWQQGTRAPGPLGLMKAVAAKLSDADIQAVAAYFSALPASDASRRNKP